MQRRLTWTLVALFLATPGAFVLPSISLPHSAAMQYTHYTPVPRADLQAGDLVFYRYSAVTIHHLGIYVGHDTMIDAPCTGEVVGYDAPFGDFFSGGRK